MRKVNVKLKNRNGEDIIYEEISKVKLNTSKGEAVFSLGIPKELSVTPEFLSGNIEVLAPDDTLYEKVTINKPENLVPENIAKDVVVAGITGTFEGKPELPTLNKPSISRNLETISITNPSSNGNFNKKFIIYSNDEIAFDQTSTSFVVTNMFDSEKDYNIQTSCFNPLMNESPKSDALKISVYSIEKVLDEHLSTTDTRTKICDGIDYSFSIKKDTGFWFPENVSVYYKKNGETEYKPYTKYEYSMYTGQIVIKNVLSNLKIVAIADDEPILKRPDIEFDYNNYIVNTNFTRYSERLLFYLNNEFIEEEIKAKDPITVTYDTLGLTYTFNLKEDGYFWPTGKGVNGSYSIIRLCINNEKEDTNFRLNWMQNSENNYDFGIVGLIDTPLTRSNSEDSNITLSAKGKNYTEAQNLILDAPLGNHFYEIKYRKDNSVNNGWDAFIFNIDLTDLTRKIKSDNYYFVQGVLFLENEDYEMKSSSNVTHHVYIDGIEIYTKKEGI